MKKKYQDLEMEMVYFDTGTEVHTCTAVDCLAVEACPEHGCMGDADICEEDGPICRCNNDIIHTSGE